MTLCKLQTATGRLFRLPALHKGADLSDAKAGALPGSIALNADGLPFISSPFTGTSEGQTYRRIFTLTPDSLTGQLAVASNTNFPRFQLFRARANNNPIQDGDVLGEYRLGGRLAAPVDGGLQADGCRAQATVDGTVSLSSMPVRLDIFLTPIGSITPFSFLRVTPDGRLLVGNTTGTERVSVTGNLQLTEATNSLKIGNDFVVGARKTGWVAPTGTATRATFATYAGQNVSATYEEAEVQAIDDHLKILSERLKALIDDLTSHGLVGPTPTP